MMSTNIATTVTITNIETKIFGGIFMTNTLDVLRWVIVEIS